MKIHARRYNRFRDRREGDAADEGEGDELDDEQLEEPVRKEDTQDEEERGRTMVTPKKTRSRKEPESTVDILYENQRGGFLCGIPLFSAQALGSLDPPPWTNAAFKPSATDITNAQVPDPSWQWAWKEWVINRQEGLDEDGWEYSFAFSKNFSWHGPHYWNSFVRRRAWIRKRVKKQSGYQDDDEGMNSRYFTIRPPSTSRSRASSQDGSRRYRNSMHSSRRGVDDEAITGDIENAHTLMRVLRACRIDREKMEAVENFIEHGEAELHHLGGHMHDIMRMFIFQASRRLLLAHLLEIFNEALDAHEKIAKNQEETEPPVQHRIDHLAEAVKHADEEVKKLEFWSDVKRIADAGVTKGAVDEGLGWGDKWTGLDRSGPENVISNRKRPGLDDCDDNENIGGSVSPISASSKGKAQE
jgi:hypothetical protein